MFETVSNMWLDRFYSPMASQESVSEARNHRRSLDKSKRGGAMAGGGGIALVQPWSLEDRNTHDLRSLVIVLKGIF